MEQTNNNTKQAWYRVFKDVNSREVSDSWTSIFTERTLLGKIYFMVQVFGGLALTLISAFFFFTFTEAIIRNIF